MPADKFFCSKSASDSAVLRGSQVSSDKTDLLTDIPPRCAEAKPRAEPPPELRTARALCRRLKRTAPRPEKQRIAHEICASLIALCKRGRGHSL